MLRVGLEDVVPAPACRALLLAAGEDVVPCPRMSSDLALLSAWQTGDEQAGNTLFERHFDAIFKFFRNKVGAGAADDLVQQTFLACVTASSTFRGDASFRSYLFTIAKSKLYDYLRQRRSSERLDPLEQSVADLGESPSRYAAEREDRRLLEAALQRIPVELQIAIELFYFDELPAAEVAAVLGIPEGTVRSRVRRGLELLRSEVTRLGQELHSDMGETHASIALLDAVEQKRGAG